MKKKKLPVSVSSFKRIIEDDYIYIDKTLFIKEIIDHGDTILLIPRPRRFGKTLNLSMIRFFYDCCPEIVSPDEYGKYPTNKNDLPKNSYNSLFDNLSICKAGEEYIKKMGKYPVIFLSFKNVKQNSWESCYEKIIQVIVDEYSRHYYLLYSLEMKPHEKDYFNKIINKKGTISDYEVSLGKLLEFLSKYYATRVVILIDEYDAPVHAGYTNDYYDDVIGFIRNFLCSGLKDTDEFLEKSIITGILRIAKESIFSGLNNPGVYSLTAKEFNDKFGFTEEEIEILLSETGFFDRYSEIKEWYNGYRFGNRIIYNPWSIINYINSSDKIFRPYWVNTSDNLIIDTLLSNGGKVLNEELEQLIRGDSIDKIIDENIVLKDLSKREDLLWSFLLMGGYLKPIREVKKTDSENITYSLSIPNKEVRSVYKQIVRNYFSRKIENEKLETMLNALIDGDIALFEKMLQKVVIGIFSYHDFNGEPEKVYHAFVAGLLVWISDSHEIKSNRESGYGRYDIMIIPKNSEQVGYVIEFKAVDTGEGEVVQDAIEAALKQIEEKKYETELMERGIKSIKKLAIVFNGKDVVVQEGI